MENQRRKVYDKYGDKKTLMHWAKQNGINVTGNETKDILIELLLHAPNKPSSTEFVKMVQKARANVYKQIGTVSTLQEWAKLHDINVYGLKTKKELIRALVNSSRMPSSTEFYKRFAQTNKKNSTIFSTPPKHKHEEDIQSSSSSSSKALVKQKLPSSKEHQKQSVKRKLSLSSLSSSSSSQPIIPIKKTSSSSQPIFPIKKTNKNTGSSSAPSPSSFCDSEFQRLKGEIKKLDEQLDNIVQDLNCVNSSNDRVLKRIQRNIENIEHDMNKL